MLYYLLCIKNSKIVGDACPLPTVLFLPYVVGIRKENKFKRFGQIEC